MGKYIIICFVSICISQTETSAGIIIINNIILTINGAKKMSNIWNRYRRSLITQIQREKSTAIRSFNLYIYLEDIIQCENKIMALWTDSS